MNHGINLFAAISLAALVAGCCSPTHLPSADPKAKAGVGAINLDIRNFDDTNDTRLHNTQWTVMDDQNQPALAYNATSNILDWRSPKSFVLLAHKSVYPDGARIDAKVGIKVNPKDVICQLDADDDLGYQAAQESTNSFHLRLEFPHSNPGEKPFEYYLAVAQTNAPATLTANSKLNPRVLVVPINGYYYLVEATINWGTGLRESSQAK